MKDNWPTKITDQNWCIECVNDAHFLELKNYALKCGVPIYPRTKDRDSIRGHHFLVFSGEELIGSMYSNGFNHLISTGHYMTLCDKYKAEKGTEPRFTLGMEVWAPRYGEGVIGGIQKGNYPIIAHFAKGKMFTYTLEGKCLNEARVLPTLRPLSEHLEEQKLLKWARKKKAKKAKK